MSVLSVVLIGIGLVLLVPTGVLWLEILLSKTPATGRSAAGVDTGHRAAVLIPAHNEAGGVAKTITNLKAQLGSRDIILVVADNCTDETADIAAKSGAQVLVRNDTTRRGKGYAVAFGVEHLKSLRPDVLVFVDADCVLAPNSINVLTSTALAKGRPIQSLNLMRAPRGHERRYAVAEFAWRVKNKVRPLGLARLRLPCQLMGTGMAMPMSVAAQLDFASGNVVEDLELGVKLAALGYPAFLTLESRVDSEFPITQEGESKQRQRWEGGSLSMLARGGIKTILSGLWQGKLSLFGLGLDMIVPPLVTHVAVLIAYFIVCLLSLSNGAVHRIRSEDPSGISSSPSLPAGDRIPRRRASPASCPPFANREACARH